MHAGEPAIDAGLVSWLVAAQFPGLAGLPVTPVRPAGTVNALFRIGDELCVRLPRLRKWAADLDKEQHWLPRLAPLLPLRVPEPLAPGHPAGGYPFSWAIYRWIDGQPYRSARVADEREAARDLAGFVSALRQVPPGAGVPRGGRAPLRELDRLTRDAIEESRDVVDSQAALAAWERALDAPAWDGLPVWVHADLLRPNLLTRDGRLQAVIDFGSAGAGDPAADVIAAWSVFGRAGRAEFRSALEVEDGTWERARGYALHQAALIIPYYRETNPGFAALAERTMTEILS